MRIKTITLAILTLCLACSTQASDRKLYFSLDGGMTLNSSTTFESFAGITPNSTIKFNNGGRFGLTAGYAVNDWFALELESGFGSAFVKSFTGGAAVTAADTSVSQVPFLVNAIFRVPTNSKFVPYLGVGAGGSASVFNTDFLTVAGSGVAVSGADATMVLAAQGVAGFRFDISERVALGINYKYFYAGAPEWNSVTTIRMGKMEFHSFNLALNFKF